jgi:hypothetical protein
LPTETGIRTPERNPTDFPAHRAYWVLSAISSLLEFGSQVVPTFAGLSWPKPYLRFESTSLRQPVTINRLPMRACATTTRLRGAIRAETAGNDEKMGERFATSPAFQRRSLRSEGAQSSFVPVPSVSREFISFFGTI